MWSRGEAALIGVIQVRSSTQMRVLAVSIVVSFCLMVSACGSSTTSSSSTPKTTPSSSTPKTSAATTSLHLPQGQVASVGGIWNVSIGDSFYVSSVREEHFAVVVVTMKNVSSASQSEDPSSWSSSVGSSVRPLICLLYTSPSPRD